MIQVSEICRYRQKTFILLTFITINAVVFVNSQLSSVKTLSFPENVPPGAYVGSLAISSAAGQATYEVTNKNTPLIGAVDGSVTLDDLFDFQFNGDIYSKEMLDREEISTYLIVVYSGSPYVVTLNILDINDNAPQFRNLIKNLSVPENTKVGDQLSLLGSAVDADNGVNSTQRYEIVDGNDGHDFRLELTQVGGLEDQSVVLKLNGTLDYETQRSYRLVVRAYDGDGKFGDLVVNVQVLDVNDVIPEFDISLYTAQVLENATIGQTVLTVRASDEEEGEYGEVVYELSSENTSPNYDHFDIDTNTGSITVKQKLNYVLQNQYRLRVLAKNPRAVQQSSSAVVDIQVINVNDQPPTITVDRIVSEVAEDLNQGTAVIRLSIDDEDGSETSNFSLTLSNTNGSFALVKRDRDIYLIVVNGDLDRETTAVYNITVTAWDDGTPPLSSTEQVSIHISDKNDNPPTFDRDEYTFQVDEQVPTDSPVGKVTAVDRDVGQNALITYSLLAISGKKSDYFAVHNLTGMIETAKEPIDCNSLSQPQFYIQATDNGIPPQSSQVLVKVNIMDINDNEPEFDSTFYDAQIPENRQPGSEPIIVVTATDSDCGASSEVTFSLSERGVTPPDVFTINRVTGAITVSGQLDYETSKLYEFPVMAIDQGGQVSSVNVKVTITDVNDNNPVFYPLSYAANVRSSNRPGDVLIIVKATDADSGLFGQVTYSLASENINQQYFEVDADTGAVKLKQVLPSNAPSVFSLSIRAQDGEGKQAITPANLNVIVVREEQQTPRFARSLYSFSVDENVQFGQRVGSVSATVQGGTGSLSYSITSGDPRSYFNMNSLTGEITTTRVNIDRETYDYVLLGVRADSDGVFGSTQVNVSVIDKNDNSPVFTSMQTTVPVPENQLLTEPLYTVQATDADIGENGHVRYTITSNPNNKFTINPSSGTLTLRELLDYEQKKSYVLTVQAYDNGSPVKRSNLNITVTVQDVNDNPPIFSSNQFVVRMSEAFPSHTIIQYINATDADSGQNGKLTYSIGENQEEFGIYPSTGQLFNSVSFSSMERRQPYTIHITATDGGGLTATCTVVIHINDENDNVPQFAPNATDTELTVDENSSISKQIGQIIATDKDAGNNSLLVYSLPDAITSFRINRNNGKIYVNEIIDREERAVYEFTVTVRDSGKTQLWNTTTLRVRVIDVNDNAPAFQGLEGGILPAFVYENRPENVFIVQVTALDPDFGDNGKVTYSLTGDHLDKFEIDPNSGWLKARVTFDREAVSQYNLTAKATDHGTPEMQTKVVIMVNVQDENEPPRFTSSYLKLSTDENIPPGTVIGYVQAFDDDQGENGHLRYTVIRYNPSIAFDVNMTSGAVFSVLPVDYEKVASHWLLVSAVDRSLNASSGTNMNVTIDVLDVNDNKPLFAHNPTHFSIVENTEVGQVIGRVSASDVDSGPNGEVMYEIAMQFPNETRSMFAINPDTGDIRTAMNIDYELFPSVLLVIKATDKPENVSARTHSTMSVVVTIKDLNDNYPDFKSRNTVNVAEDEPVGFPLLHIYAKDKDKNNSIRYTIISGDPDNKFTLSSDTGELKLNNELDREANSSYVLKVNATDTGNPPNHATQTIHINVIDVNDNAPKFLSRTYTANVSEAQLAHALVKQISAVDPDEGVNAELEYIIPEGLADDMFSVDRNGMITTTVQLDREQRSSYEFSAYVRDGAFPARYDWCTVTVTVNDINDHAPYFSSESYFQAVPENLRENSSIFQVVALDDDIGANARITYSIIDGNDGNIFTIDRNDGRIYASSLDREEKEKYTLTVQAKDHGDVPMQRTASVVVTVTDRNDNDPKFSIDGDYHAELNETVAPGSVVIGIQASDADKGNNARISYFLNNGTDGKFVIDRDTGEITTSRVSGHFDREKQAAYRFAVTAQDNAEFDPRSKQTWVEVTITDVNDNAPVFREVPYRRNITQFVNIDDTVLTVVAEDKDEGVNKKIEYSIISGDNYFSIDPRTGDIKLSQSIGQVQRVHKLQVRAKDQGVPQLYSDGWVEINIGSPSGQQSFKFDNSSYTVYLDEDAPQGSLVLKLTASHRGGSTSGISYSLTGDGGAMNNPFAIDSRSGELRVAAPEKLDYEMMTTKRFQFMVVASSQSYTDYCTVLVNVRDKNDNSPVFTQDRYHGQVDERYNESTYITLVLATDADSGDNGRIEYRLQGENANFLDIGSRTGIVSLARRIDRETSQQIRVTIVAEDKGNPSRTGTSVLRVTVLDDNDNAPTFTNLANHQSNNPVSVKEDMSIGQEVYVVSALDRDLTPEVMFDFVSGGNPEHTFNIDHFTGRITLAKSLDHETVSEYTLALVVNDTKHATYGSLSVRVLDENDNNPQFNQSKYIVELAEQQASEERTSVLKVLATDADSGANGRITYSLQGTSADKFFIDASDGWIYTNAEIKYSDDPTIMLAVKATDGGVPELSALAFAQIYILDINNFAPVFSSPDGYNISVSEDEAPGVTIKQLSASDSDDSPENKKITFSIVDGNELGVFGIENREPNIGGIVLMDSLDRETIPRYEITVMAADSGTPAKSSVTKVILMVSDVNDWPPVFKNTERNGSDLVIKAYAAENITSGSPIIRVEAEDKDVGDNAVIDYIFTSGNDDGLFNINQTSGLIKLARGKSLDYDTKQEHRMQIRANDNGGPRQSALVTVVLIVSDINDNAPTFLPLMYLETIEENKPSGTEVFTAQAHDNDAGIYGQLTYALKGEKSANFHIDSKTGKVTSAVAFNFEGVQNYNFEVTATDRGGLQATRKVSVNVLSVDDHVPKFDASSGYKFSVDAKTAKVGDLVGTVYAEDKDRGEDGIVQYTLMGENPYFAVTTVRGSNADDSYGSIRVNRSLIDNPKMKRSTGQLRRHRRDAAPNTILTIKAYSGKKNSLYAVTNVTISVSGVAAPTEPVRQTTPAAPGGPLSTTEMIIIIVVISLVVLILIVVIIVIKMRTCRNTKREDAVAAARRLGGDMDSIPRAEYGIMRTGSGPPPPYGNAHYGQYTGSQDYTDRSQCASSGRGSAEFDDGDEEITAINTVPLHVQQRNKMMPDSGIQRDADTVSEHSAKDHQEYLARLGIDSKNIGGDKKELGQSVESMHQFSDEGGGEADPLDISNLYSKLTEDGGEAGETTMKQMGFGEAPAQIGSLSSVTDASEEFTGSYNWDYLLDWGPQYQPLADVFAEIARLKDETIQPKRKPVQTIPQSGQGMSRPLQQPAFKVGGPPPIITGAPPRVDYRGRDMSNLSSARTSQLTSMISLPHSPISHESSFSNLAFSPNFTPALSPLGTRSPSVSTLQSGQSTPNRLGQRSLKNMPKPASVTESSDIEFRI